MRDSMSGCLRQYYPPLDPKPVFCTFLGMCVMNLAYNHSEYKELVGTFLKLSKEEQQKDMLVITYIVPGMPLYEYNTLNVGEIVEFVNGVKVSTLDEYKRALCTPLNTPGGLLLDVRTRGKRRFVMDVKTALQEERDAIQKMLNVTDLGVFKTLEAMVKTQR